MGIDIEKPFKTSPLVPENGMLEYCLCRSCVRGTTQQTNKENRKCRVRDFDIVSKYKHTERIFCNKHLSN